MTTAAKATKALKEDLEYFEFERDGKTYKFEGGLSDVLTAGFLRKTRHSEDEMLWSLLEIIAGDEALAVIDKMKMDEFKEFGEELGEHIKKYQGLNLGN